jgi:hypothetical protein
MGEPEINSSVTSVNSFIQFINKREGIANLFNGSYILLTILFNPY